MIHDYKNYGRIALHKERMVKLNYLYEKAQRKAKEVAILVSSQVCITLGVLAVCSIPYVIAQVL